MPKDSQGMVPEGFGGGLRQVYLRWFRRGLTGARGGGAA